MRPLLDFLAWFTTITLNYIKMKKITLSLIVIGAFTHIHAQVNHQTGNYYFNNPTVPATTFNPAANFSSSLGGNNNIVGSYSLASGYMNKVNAYGTFATGTYVTSNGLQSQGFGSFLRTDCELSFTFGAGTSAANPFINPFAKTFAISWNTTTPAFVVRNMAGDQRAGIGTFSPVNKLHIATGDDQGISLVSMLPINAPISSSATKQPISTGILPPTIISVAVMGIYLKY